MVLPPALGYAMASRQIKKMGTEMMLLKLEVVIHTIIPLTALGLGLALLQPDWLPLSLSLAVFVS